jgi:hypothetical protein
VLLVAYEVADARAVIFPTGEVETWLETLDHGAR